MSVLLDHITVDVRHFQATSLNPSLIRRTPTTPMSCLQIMALVALGRRHMPMFLYASTYLDACCLSDNRVFQPIHDLLINACEELGVKRVP